MTSARDRLHRLADVLSASRACPLHLGAPPAEPAWCSLDEAVERLPGWHAHLTGAVGDRRAAAAYLGSWTCQAVTTTVGLPAVLAGVLVDVDGGASVWMRRHPDGWFDRHTVDAEVSEGSHVLDAAGTRIARLAGPLVDAAAAALPIGRPALWGGLADRLCATSIRLARAGGGDPREAWKRAHRILDVTARHAPVRRRPVLYPVTWRGGESVHQVRATCCLYYRTCDDATPDGDRYCTTCPLRSDASRTERLVAHLEATAGR